MMYRTLIVSLLCTLTLFGCESKKSVDSAETSPEAPKEAAEKPTQKAPAKTEDAPKTEEKVAENTKEAPNPGGEPLGVGGTPKNIEPGQTNVYGSRFTIIEEPKALAAVIDSSPAEDQLVKVSAKIEKVCQSKGCWMTLQADGVKYPVRVKMKEYGFFVPMNSAGMDVIAEGTLEKTQLSQDEAQHYADDEAANTGKPAEKIDGPQDTYIFMANAIEITSAKS